MSDILVDQKFQLYFATVFSLVVSEIFDIYVGRFPYILEDSPIDFCPMYIIGNFRYVYQKFPIYFAADFIDCFTIDTKKKTRTK